MLHPFDFFSFVKIYFGFNICNVIPFLILIPKNIYIFLIIFLSIKRNNTSSSQQIKYSKYGFTFEYPKNAKLQEKGYSVNGLLDTKSDKELLKKTESAYRGTPNSNSGSITIEWSDRMGLNNLSLIWYKCIPVEQYYKLNIIAIIDSGLSRGLQGMMLSPGISYFRILEKGSESWNMHTLGESIRYQAYEMTVRLKVYYGINTIILCPNNGRMYTIAYVSEQHSPIMELYKFLTTFKCHL